jgi:hypothetical protein
MEGNREEKGERGKEIEMCLLWFFLFCTSPQNTNVEVIKKRKREGVPSSIELSASLPAWSSALMSVHNTVSMSTELNWDATPVSPPLEKSPT